MTLDTLIEPERCLLYPEAPENENTVLRDLASSAKNHVQSQQDLYDALLKREATLSTAVGSGIAFPHNKSHNIKETFISVAACPEGLDWNALDGKKVELIFLICCPLEEQSSYLQILAQIAARFVKNEKNKQKLLQEVDKEFFFTTLKGIFKES